MVIKVGPKTSQVDTKELGTNCWCPCRFIQDDGRCCRIWTCSYPEKKTCQAIRAEIRYLKLEQLRMARVISNIDIRIEELALMLEK